TAFVQQGLPGLAPKSGDDALDPTLFPASAHVETAPPLPDHDDAASADAPRSRMASFLTWRRAIVAGVTAFAILGALTAGWLGLRALGMGPMASLLAAAEIEQNDRILIADFDPRGADTTIAAVVT